MVRAVHRISPAREVDLLSRSVRSRSAERDPAFVSRRASREAAQAMRAAANGASGAAAPAARAQPPAGLGGPGGALPPNANVFGADANVSANVFGADANVSANVFGADANANAPSGAHASTPQAPGGLGPLGLPPFFGGPFSSTASASGAVARPSSRQGGGAAAPGGGPDLSRAPRPPPSPTPPAPAPARRPFAGAGASTPDGPSPLSKVPSLLFDMDLADGGAGGAGAGGAGSSNGGFLPRSDSLGALGAAARAAGLRNLPPSPAVRAAGLLPSPRARVPRRSSTSGAGAGTRPGAGAGAGAASGRPGRPSPGGFVPTPSGGFVFTWNPQVSEDADGFPSSAAASRSPPTSPEAAALELLGSAGRRLAALLAPDAEADAALRLHARIAADAAKKERAAHAERGNGNGNGSARASSSGASNVSSSASSSSSRASSASSAAASSVALARGLRRLGYDARARGSRGAAAAEGAACLRNLKHEFVVVHLPNANGSSHAPAMQGALHRAHCTVPLSSAAESPSAPSGGFRTYVVDPRFREQFETAACDERYRALLALLPALGVVRSDRMRELVELVCAEMAACFKAHGLALPPWRGASATLSRWRDDGGEEEEDEEGEEDDGDRGGARARGAAAVQGAFGAREGVCAAEEQARRLETRRDRPEVHQGAEMQGHLENQGAEVQGHPENQGTDQGGPCASHGHAKDAHHHHDEHRRHHRRHDAHRRPGNRELSSRSSQHLPAPVEETQPAASLAPPCEVPALPLPAAPFPSPPASATPASLAFSFDSLSSPAAGPTAALEGEGGAEESATDPSRQIGAHAGNRAGRTAAPVTSPSDFAHDPALHPPFAPAHDDGELAHGLVFGSVAAGESSSAAIEDDCCEEDSVVGGSDRSAGVVGSDADGGLFRTGEATGAHGEERAAGAAGAIDERAGSRRLADVVAATPPALEETRAPHVQERPAFAPGPARVCGAALAAFGSPATPGFSTPAGGSPACAEPGRASRGAVADPAPAPAQAQTSALAPSAHACWGAEEATLRAPLDAARALASRAVSLGAHPSRHAVQGACLAPALGPLRGSPAVDDADSDVAAVDSEAALSEDEARARRGSGAPLDDDGSGRGGQGYEDLGAPLCVVGSLQRNAVAQRHGFSRTAFAQ